MLAAGTKIKPLLLAGGQSSRMGSDKFLLKLPHGKPLYQHFLDLLCAVFPDSGGAYVSLHDEEQMRSISVKLQMEDVQVLYDPITPFSNGSGDAAQMRNGPAAGLLAAYQHDPTVYWAVLACDYPLMTCGELLQLVMEYEEPVTTLQNSRGFLEPLVAIWSPTALRELQTNVVNGCMGPTVTVRQLKGKSISPLKEESLLNTNTPEEWRRAMKVMYTGTA